MGQKTADDKVAVIRRYCESMLALDDMHGGKRSGIMGYYALMLERGVEFRGRALSSEYPETDDYRRHFNPQIKQCFYNSQMFVLALGTEVTGRYFEGYAYNSLFPFHHAWVVMPDDRVVDFTLEAAESFYKRDKIGGTEPESVAYLGVEVPVGALRKLVLRYKSSEPYAHMHYLKTKMRFF